MELISIVITTHNRDQDLDKAIISAINQSYSNIEIIIIDDNPTQATLNVVQKFENKVNYVKSNKKGLTCSRNLGIELSKGDFVVFLDDDDELLEKSIEKRLNCFNNLDDELKNKTAVIYSGCSISIVKQKRVAISLPKIQGKIKDSIKEGVISTIPSTFFLPKFILLKYNLKFDESFSSFVDHDFLLKLAYCDLDMYYVNEPLTKTYVFPAKKSMVNDVDKRIKYIKKLFGKWNGFLLDIMPVDNYNKFISIYVANEYSNLIVNSFISKDFSSIYKILSDIKNYQKLSLRILKLIIIKVNVKLLRLITPTFIINIIK
jgi:glycosyltransferase involved in cell wall biosynthesis